ncbi:MAG: sensor histidine kinase, partial [Thiotrichaceae bacterium]
QLAIPIQYRNKMIGVYNIRVDKEYHPKFGEEHELLLSIGQHLGMAIEKANVDTEARTLSIMEERTRMAHELHDSLAQTLASMRYKVRLLDDSLNSDDDELIWGELEGLEGIIDDANTELRSLITDFRAPIDGSGLVRSVERMANRFQVDTGLEVFFYQNWYLEEIPRDIELEVVRIVQEALANIRKHSKAETVRILMHSTEKGDCRILVEDDGIGFDDALQDKPTAEGEHIGLTVMQERAARINGEIQFESEEGEGTLIQLSFMSAPENETTVVTP